MAEVGSQFTEENSLLGIPCNVHICTESHFATYPLLHQCRVGSQFMKILLSQDLHEMSRSTKKTFSSFTPLQRVGQGSSSLKNFQICPKNPCFAWNCMKYPDLCRQCILANPMRRWGVGQFIKKSYFLGITWNVQMCRKNSFLPTVNPCRGGVVGKFTKKILLEITWKSKSAQFRIHNYCFLEIMHIFI